MAKGTLTPAPTLALAGAEATTRNGLTFVFACETLSDGTPTMIYANVRITNSGEVRVRDYEVRRGQNPGTDQEAVGLCSNDDMDGSALAGYYLADFVSRTQ